MSHHENKLQSLFHGLHVFARRFIVPLFLCIILAFSLSACTIRFSSSESNQAAPSSLKTPPSCEKLWNLNIGEDGFSKTSASYISMWTCENVALTLIIQPKAYHTVSIENSKKIVEGATTYYLRKDEVSWDAEGWKSGTIYSQTISFEENDLACSLGGEADKKDVPLDIVSLNTTRKLAADSEGGTPPFEKTAEYWAVGFQKENISLSVTFIPPPFDRSAYAQWAESEDTVLIRVGSLEYYTTNRQQTPDAPNAKVIAYLSDDGLIEVRGGVPYRFRNDVPRDALDFINIEFVKNVFETK